MTYDPVKNDIQAMPYDDEGDRRDMERVKKVARHLDITLGQARQLLEMRHDVEQHLEREQERHTQKATILGRYGDEPKGTERLNAAIEAADEQDAEQVERTEGEAVRQPYPRVRDYIVGLLASAFATAAIYFLTF